MIWNNIRYAFGMMRRSPGFTVVAVLSLALGIGANTAIFSLFYTIVLRTLPVARPEQLVEFLQSQPGQPRSSSYWEWESYELFRDHNQVFSAMTGMSFDNLAPSPHRGLRDRNPHSGECARKLLPRAGADTRDWAILHS
jgi:putative ABC transport system permease protein